MRGRAPGEQLDIIRSVCCARNGLNLVMDGKISREEAASIHQAYSTSIDTFVEDMTGRISTLSASITENENPADAIELAMVAGLLVDRLTNRALMTTKPPKDETHGTMDRQRHGIVVTSSECEETIPYTGKESK